MCKNQVHLGGVDTISTLRATVQKLTAEVDGCRAILERQLDRDNDPKDSLQDLVVVACNALYWARAKKKYFRKAKVEAENKNESKSRRINASNKDN